MRGVALLLLVALAVGVFGEEEACDPPIPRDKCGLVIACNEDESTEIFILGPDGAFYHKYEFEDREWSPWLPLGGNFRGGPAVVRSADGRLAIFGRSKDNRIWHKYQATPNSLQYTLWQPLGENVKLSSSPIAILSSEGFIHVFGKGMDHTLMHRTQYTNNSVFEWNEWTSLGGSLTSQPDVLLDAEGLIHVFVRGPDRALWHKYQVGGQEPRFIKWSEWQNLGGVLASSPRVPISLNTVNLLEIFVRASDKAYWHRSQVASLPGEYRQLDWTDWQSVGGVFSSGPASVINGEGLLEVYGRGTDKAVWRKRQYSSEDGLKWSAWTSLRGITSTGPAVRVRPTGQLDVFTRGVDKQIWKKSEVVVGNFTEFSRWQPMDSTVLAEAFSC